MRRLDRLLALLLLLRSRRGVTMELLRAEFGVSERTVYRDLRSLEAAGVPIVLRPSVGYGLVERYHLPPVMLSRGEVTSLCFALGFAEALTDEATVRELRSASSKITSVLPEPRRGDLERTREHTRVLQRSSDYSRRYEGTHLMAIQAAIADRKCLRLRYYSNSRNAVTEREVEPLGLLYYGDHWHLAGYCRLREDFRDFRADRIQRLEPRGRFQPRVSHSWQRFLETFDSGRHHRPVRIRVPAELAEYLRDKSHYWLEEDVRDGDSVCLGYRVPSLDAIAGWLLALGERVEVLHPEALRLELARRGRALAAHHARGSASTD